MVRDESTPGAFRRLWTRDINGGHYAVLFLISAVSTILLVRAFLAATGYPQVGGKSQLHIAHMLWGGLLMLIALALTFMLWSDVWKTFNAVIGGIGFGLFIDELGKFITKDNDYFFSPTIAILYMIFVLFFILSRLVSRTKTFSPFEIRMNALTALERMAIGRLGPDERDQALRVLATVPCGAPSASMVDTIVPLTPDVTAVRLFFLSPTQRTMVLPSRLRISYRHGAAAP